MVNPTAFFDGEGEEGVGAVEVFSEQGRGFGLGAADVEMEFADLVNIWEDAGLQAGPAGGGLVVVDGLDL